MYWQKWGGDIISLPFVCEKRSRKQQTHHRMLLTRPSQMQFIKIKPLTLRASKLPFQVHSSPISQNLQFVSQVYFGGGFLSYKFRRLTCINRSFHWAPVLLSIAWTMLNIHAGKSNVPGRHFYTSPHYFFFSYTYILRVYGLIISICDRCMRII